MADLSKLSEAARETLRDGGIDTDDATAGELIAAGLAVWRPRLEYTAAGVDAQAKLIDKEPPEALAGIVDESDELTEAVDFLEACMDDECLDGFAVDAGAAGAILADARDKVLTALGDCAAALRALPEVRRDV